MASWKLPSGDGRFRELMGKLGSVIGTHPFPFLIFPPLIAAALSYPFVSGIVRHSRVSGEPDRSLKLFTPSNSPSEVSRRRMSEIFPDGGYFTDRSLISPNLLIILVSAKDGGTVFREHIVQQYAELRSTLEQFTEANVDGISFDYKKLCLLDLFEIHCRKDPFLSIWKTHKGTLQLLRNHL